jgi:hypothetical protein
MLFSGPSIFFAAKPDFFTGQCNALIVKHALKVFHLALALLL